MDPLSKIDQLQQKFAGALPEDKAAVDQWERDLHRDLITADLANHEAMKRLLAGLRKDIDDMDHLLRTADSQTLPDIARDRVLDRKHLFTVFVDFFAIAQSNLDATVKKIDDNL
jgi:hypothetical protein